MEQEMKQEQVQAEKQETPKKQKKSKASYIVTPLIIIAVIAGAFIYWKSLVKPCITVNGEEIKIHMTVQELVDAGYAIDDSIVGSGDLDISKVSDIPGESYSSKSYYLYVENEFGWYDYANISFRVYNKDVNSAEFKDCKVYSYQYDPSYRFNETSILINDIDFVGMDKEDAVLAFEELGVKFDADDKEEFLSGEATSIIGKSGSYHFYIVTDVDRVTITKIEIRYNV